MTIVDDRYIVAPNLSQGWIDALEAMLAVPSRKAVHLIVRILDPTAEDLAVRAAAQRLIDDWNAAHTRLSDQLYDVETTRNTIFPAAWARRHPVPSDLAAYYRQHYTKDGLRGFRDNNRGTYFGRIVAYPRGDAAPGDQLTDTVRKLRDELRTRSNKSSRYEINVYSEACDTSPMSFPCLAHISVHLHDGALHMQAIYRNEYLVGRAYGNYLGLAQLQTYMATAAGTDIGELLMTINHLELDASKRAVRKILPELHRDPAS
jgi:thymidylate synthase